MQLCSSRGFVSDSWTTCVIDRRLMGMVSILGGQRFAVQYTDQVDV